MGRFRARLLCVTAIVAGGLVMALRGQTREIVGLDIQNIGLPAIEQGVFAGPDAREPDTVSSRRSRFRAALQSQRRGASGAAYTPGRVLVKFRAGASAASRLSAMRSVSRTAALTTPLDYADFDVVQIDPNEDAEAAALDFSRRSDVEYAQAAYRVHTMLVPNDPLYAQMQWNLPLINMEKAWDIQPQAGSTITVAVLDSGLAYQNATITASIPAFRDDLGNRYPALGSVTIPYAAATQLVNAANAGRIVAPHDFIWDTSQPPFDFEGHGTHVSGTIGQLTNDGIGTAGVAFNVKLMPVKVIQSDWDFLFGSPNQGDDADVARGIRYAADNGAKVINMSIGRTGPPDTAPAVEAAMRYAVDKGVFIAVAAGNDFEDGNPKEIIAEIATRIAGVVSVAAVDRAKNHAFYSNTGSWVELSAPGGSTRGFGSAGAVYQQTFNPNFTDTFLLPPSQYVAPRFDVLAYVPYQGTSMATPHVAGVAAMLMQQGITDPAAIEDALEKFAVDLGTAGRDDTFGFGLIDARATLRGLGLAK